MCVSSYWLVVLVELLHLSLVSHVAWWSTIPISPLFFTYLARLWVAWRMTLILNWFWVACEPTLILKQSSGVYGSEVATNLARRACGITLMIFQVSGISKIHSSLILEQLCNSATPSGVATLPFHSPCASTLTFGSIMFESRQISVMFLSHFPCYRWFLMNAVVFLSSVIGSLILDACNCGSWWCLHVRVRESIVLALFFLVCVLCLFPPNKWTQFTLMNPLATNPPIGSLSCHLSLARLGHCQPRPVWVVEPAKPIWVVGSAWPVWVVGPVKPVWVFRPIKVVDPVWFLWVFELT